MCCKISVRFFLCTLVLMLLSISCSLQAAEIGFDDAQWIWHSPSTHIVESPHNYQAGVRYFRKDFSVLENPAVISTEIIITCDNLFVLYVNGQVVGASETIGDSWKQSKRFDLSENITPGRVVLAVKAVNTASGPSGLLVKFVATLANGEQIVLSTDATWKSSAKKHRNWVQSTFNDQQWANAKVVAKYGEIPWGAIDIPKATEPSPSQAVAVQRIAAKISSSSYNSNTVLLQEPSADFSWPEGLIYVGDDCSLYRPDKKTGYSATDSLTVTVFNPRKSRAFPEHDLPAPMKVGRKLMKLKPAMPGVEPTLLLDTGKGALGSPSVSFDGQWIYFSMAREEDDFFHLFRISSQGGEPEQLTEGPFFDIDPAELPDGRIVFASTRMGTFEEYHSPPSRALFVMNADGSDIHPITNTIIFDNEPEVLADGRILFIRSDNFFDRGKVETLLHATFPDGTRGYTEFGLDNGPEYGGRLRANYCGSPAPMPDGRVAYLSNAGITVGRVGNTQGNLQHVPLKAGDVASLPDGRLLCTVLGAESSEYDSINILNPDSRPVVMTKVLDTGGQALHSPVFLGARTRPALRPDQVRFPEDPTKKATGFLICQNAQFTKNTTAGWERVRAIRVLAGKGLTTRSSHSYIVHAGNETVELGTVPLAPDGSFSIEVPADTPLALQAVDAEGRSELNEMSWIYVRPGEKKSCVGCHQPRQSTPLAAGARPMALSSPPVKLLGNGDPHRFRGNNPAVTGLMELQFDRFREVASINRHSETADPLATGHDEVDALIALLQGDDAELKVSSAYRLAIFRDPKAAPALVELLSDEVREVRVAATVALASCGTRESVPPLLEVISDDDLIVSQGAIVALENLTGQDQSTGYYKRFEASIEPQYQAKAWKEWYADTTWEALESSLQMQLRTGNRTTVRNAAVALSHIGTAVSQKALSEYILREERNNPHPAWRRNGHSGDNAQFNSKDSVNPRTLQAVTRALGAVGNAESVPLLVKLLDKHSKPGTGNLFLAEAAAEALGMIGTSEAETALIEAFSQLKDYPNYTRWYGDHDALMSCHASPIHYFILQALDAMASNKTASILSDIIRSVPIDPDRALLLPNDDYEALVGRILRRHDESTAIIESCLALLGDPNAKGEQQFTSALSKTIRCWAGHPGPENRAAQIVSLLCRDDAYTPRIEAALIRYCTKESDIQRVFNTGIPIVDKLPVENWVSFYLARTLGNLSNPQSATTLIRILEESPAEASTGRPDPLGPGVLFLHNGLTPCWRAAVAWALGEIGDSQAAPVLLNIVRDLDNATDTRHAAAVALGRIANDELRVTIGEIAADYPEQSTRLALLKASHDPKK